MSLKWPAVLQFIPHLTAEGSAKQWSRMKEGDFLVVGPELGLEERVCQRDRELNSLCGRGREVQSLQQKMSAERWKLPVWPSQADNSAIAACTFRNVCSPGIPESAFSFPEWFRNTARAKRHQRCLGWAAGGSGVWLGRACMHAVPCGFRCSLRA